MLEQAPLVMLEQHLWRCWSSTSVDTERTRQHRSANLHRTLSTTRFSRSITRLRVRWSRELEPDGEHVVHRDRAPLRHRRGCSDASRAHRGSPVHVGKRLGHPAAGRASRLPCGVALDNREAPRRRAASASRVYCGSRPAIIVGRVIPAPNASTTFCGGAVLSWPPTPAPSTADRSPTRARRRRCPLNAALDSPSTPPGCSGASSLGRLRSAQAPWPWASPACRRWCHGVLTRLRLLDALHLRRALRAAARRTAGGGGGGGAGAKKCDLDVLRLLGSRACGLPEDRRRDRRVGDDGERCRPSLAAPGWRWRDLVPSRT